MRTIFLTPSSITGKMKSISWNIVTDIRQLVQNNVNLKQKRIIFIWNYISFGNELSKPTGTTFFCLSEVKDPISVNFKNQLADKLLISSGPENSTLLDIWERLKQVLYRIVTYSIWLFNSMKFLTKDTVALKAALQNCLIWERSTFSLCLWSLN